MVRSAQIRRATFVVANPDHVAVALRYVAERGTGTDDSGSRLDAGALRVKKLGGRGQGPDVEDRTGASAFRSRSLGPILRELYLAVAQIIAMLNRER